MINPSFIDLEIRILHRDAAGYPVELTLEGQSNSERGHLATDIIPWYTEGNVAKDGKRLFEALFHDREVHAAWTEARGHSKQRRVRLRIDPAAAELHTLPWERLHEGRAMLAADAHTPFSRYLPVPFDWGKPVTACPLRILVAISNPNDIETRYSLPKLNLKREYAAIQKLFSKLDAHQVSLEFLKAPITLDRLGVAMGKGVHILHYLGHGHFSKHHQQAALYLQNTVCDTHIVSDDALADMLARQGVRPHLVLLAACEGAMRSSVNAFVGLGPKLVTAGIPAVIAMQNRVTIKSARQVSAVFYARLMKHGIVDLALNEARSTLLSAERRDAAVPVLFMRVENGRLFTADAPLPQSRLNSLNTERLHELNTELQNLEYDKNLIKDQLENRLAGPLFKKRSNRLQVIKQLKEIEMRISEIKREINILEQKS